MTRKDIAQKLTEKLAADGLTPSLAAKVVNGMVDIIRDALVQQDNVYIRGFATISNVAHRPRKAYSFKDGKIISVPCRRVIHIKPSRELNNIINPETK